MKNLAYIAALFLFVGIFSWPYVFYQLLRLGIFLVSIFFAYNLYESKKRSQALVFLILGIVFNPFVPLYLSKPVWIVIDIVSALIYLESTREWKKNEK